MDRRDAKLDSKDLVSKFNDFLIREYGISVDDVAQAVRREVPEVFLPVGIFSTKLSTLEATIRYLREAKGFEFSHIGKLLNRSPASLTSSHRRSLKKQSERFTDDRFPAPGTIPVDIFSTRDLSPLESLVNYLKDERGLRFCEIARLLSIDQRTAWTVHSRAKRKRRSAIVR